MFLVWHKGSSFGMGSKFNVPAQWKCIISKIKGRPYSERAAECPPSPESQHISPLINFAEYW
jgi:hypothetical protein